MGIPTPASAVRATASAYGPEHRLRPERSWASIPRGRHSLRGTWHGEAGLAGLGWAGTDECEGRSPDRPFAVLAADGRTIIGIVW